MGIHYERKLWKRSNTSYATTIPPHLVRQLNPEENDIKVIFEDHRDVKDGFVVRFEKKE